MKWPQNKKDGRFLSAWMSTRSPTRRLASLHLGKSFSPNGETPTAVWVSLWTSTPTKSVRLFCSVVISLKVTLIMFVQNRLNLLQRLSTHWAFCFAKLAKILNESCEAPSIRFSPSMRESCSPSKTKSDQSAICSLPCTELSRCNPSLVVSRCSSGRQGSGMKCRNNSLHSTKKNPSRFSHTGFKGRKFFACEPYGKPAARALARSRAEKLSFPF